MVENPPVRTIQPPRRPPPGAKSTSPALRPLVLAAFVALATHGAASLAAGHTAKHSFGEATRASLGTAASRVIEGAQDVAIYALSLVGVDYRYGGETPDRGLDCSGLIRYVFQQATGVTLPRTSHELARIGAHIPRAELAPGDLVFFNTRRSAFSHVGIYLGDGQFIHAPSRGGEVGVAQLSSSYWKKRYDGARRLVGVLPALMPAIVSPALAGTAVAAPAPVGPAGPASVSRRPEDASGASAGVSTAAPPADIQP